MMSYVLWGAADALGLTRPTGPLSYALLLLTLALLLAVFHRRGGLAAFRALSRSQWALFLVLCLAAPLLSQLLPLVLPWPNAILRDHPATNAVALFAAVPALLAGAALNTPAAIVVGLLAGLGRALGQTGAPVDILAGGLAAGLSAALLRQNYSGQLFRVLRHPVTAAVAGRLTLALFVGLHVFISAVPRASFLGALDLALFLGGSSLLPLALEGLVGGILTAIGLWIAPQWRPDRGLVPSPLHRSLQRQIVAAFLSFAAVVLLLSAIVAFILSGRAAARALAEQMAFNADTVAVRLGTLQRALVDELTQSAADPALAAAEPAVKSDALGRLLERSPRFSDIALITEAGVFSDDATAVAALTPAQQVTVAEALNAGRPQLGVEEAGGERTVILAVPQVDAANRRFVLLGHIAPAALADAIGSLPLPGRAGQGLVVDEQSRVVLHTGGAPAGEWIAPRADQTAISLSGPGQRRVYQMLDPDTGARQLVYYTLVPENGWTVVAAVPTAVALRQALSVIGPLALLLLVVSGLFFAYVAGLGRAISRPIAEMGQASRAIAGGGGLERPVRPQREDEIGQLGLAFSQMQRSLRQRLDELSLLLSVSNDVAATVHIGEGMSAVLQGVLRGTGAAGARAVVRNPNSSAPLIFAEGPAAESMAALDQAVVRHVSAVEELALGSPAEIRANLGLDAPVAALFALPLRLAGEFQGALYIGYRQPHYFNNDERGLLRTLGGQAAVLVQNAYLFAAAEGGRRRLAAVLSSTMQAVVVTDQTDRVLLINPALEAAFGLNAGAVAGRPVGDVFGGLAGGAKLAERLSMAARPEAREPDSALEVEAGGRTFQASIATVQGRGGQPMGRVAVLQDVTDFKAVDRLKSEFLSGVSHDLLSPLTYMGNYADLLLESAEATPEREYAERIRGGIDRMTLLVNDLLEMARVEAGMNLQFDRVPVDELLREVALEYASPARLAGAQLVVEAPHELPPVMADPVLLRRAVTNLVTNALKYAPGSGLVTLRAERREGELLISVRDRGPGIPPAEQERLFEKFYRGQQTMAERARGSGLGLAIVKSIAEHHSGRVWCESEVGVGSTFGLALPLN